MICKYSRAEGITLLETLLILSIASALLILGVRVYSQFQYSHDIRLIAANVEQLFSAMRNYYQMNCRQMRGPNGDITSEGTLDPAVIGTDNTLDITINSATPTNTNLFTLGLLNDNTWKPLNPLVANDATDNGYSLQFVRAQNEDEEDYTTSVYACAGNENGPTTCNNDNDGLKRQILTDETTPRSQSKVIFWMTKVAVQLRSADRALNIQYESGADCITKNPTDSCDTGAIQPDPDSDDTYYLIFKKPSAILKENTSSVLWLSSPQARQFKMQYTNDGMSALSGVESSEDFYDIKNYLCGG